MIQNIFLRAFSVCRRHVRRKFAEYFDQFLLISDVCGRHVRRKFAAYVVLLILISLILIFFCGLMFSLLNGDRDISELVGGFLGVEGRGRKSEGSTADTARKRPWLPPEQWKC